MNGIEQDPPNDPSGVTSWLERLLGAETEPFHGVRHVCSSWAPEGDAQRAIRIGDAAPPSRTDFFMLCAARAWADAIVTSGKILRNEPMLTHEVGAGPIGQALRKHRREVLGKEQPPVSLVISNSGDLPPDHPVWNCWTRPVVWTAPDRVKALRTKLPPKVEVHAATEPGLTASLDYLEGLGHKDISLEVGPRSVETLYEEQRVQELWLSRFGGSEVVPEALGSPWPFTAAELEAWRVSEACEIEEISGPWFFARFRPPVAAAPADGADAAVPD